MILLTVCVMQQEEDEAHAGTDEEQQQISGHDGMKVATYKVRTVISFCFCLK